MTEQSADTIPSLRVPPYYQDDSATIYHGRCEDVMGQLVPGSVAMVLADLPYGSTKNEWDKVIDPKLLWWHFHALATEQTPFVLFGTAVFSARMVLSNEDQYKFSLVWDKQSISGHLNAKRQPLRAHEDIHVFYGQQPIYNPQMVKGAKAHSRGKTVERVNNHWGRSVNTAARDSDLQYPRSIVTFKRPKNGFHPSEKPTELLRWLVRTWTNPGLMVLDPTMGSGSTLVAAKQEGRLAIGIEGDEAYCEIAAMRLELGDEEAKARLRERRR